MRGEEKKYLLLVFIHVFLGVVVHFLPALSKLYGLIMVPVGLYYVIKSKNKNNEVLLAAAYIVGSEVFLRMTEGNILYEFSKYGVMLFVFVGMYYKGFSTSAFIYWIFLLLLVPGIIVATQTLNYDAEMRKTIAFNISGPVCLGVSALYCCNRAVTLEKIHSILLAVGLPAISCMMYLTVSSPDIETITSTGSNYSTSGGFGPNQVATILGLGMFIFFSRLIFFSKSKTIMILNLILVFGMSYRGLVTFSRGGMITGIAMLAILIISIYTKTSSSGKVKMNYLIIFFSVMIVGTWIYSSIKTSGLIEKRYANKDQMGRVKKDQLTGRGEIAASEINYFLDNPVLGIGVAKSMEMRKEVTGEIVLSHNEITRMLAEHGSFGVMALLILFLTPIIFYYDNTANIFALCCLTFWLLTINHAAMRTAAPSFIYALSLLKVKKDTDETVVYRE